MRCVREISGIFFYLLLLLRVASWTCTRLFFPSFSWESSEDKRLWWSRIILGFFKTDGIVRQRSFKSTRQLVVMRRGFQNDESVPTVFSFSNLPRQRIWRSVFLLIQKKQRIEIAGDVSIRVIEVRKDGLKKKSRRRRRRSELLRAGRLSLCDG